MADPIVTQEHGGLVGLAMSVGIGIGRYFRRGTQKAEGGGGRLRELEAQVLELASQVRFLQHDKLDLADKIGEVRNDVRRLEYDCNNLGDKGRNIEGRAERLESRVERLEHGGGQ